MNKKVVVILIILSLVVLAFARNKNGINKPDADQMLQHMSDRLDLTTEQKVSIKPLLEEKVKLMEEFHSQRKKHNDSKQQEFQTERKKLDEKISSFLTVEQKVEFTKFREEANKKHKRN